MIFKVFKNNSYAIAYGVQQLLKHTVTWKLISIFSEGSHRLFLHPAPWGDGGST